MPDTSNRNLALFALGFRPFFLGAALAGALMIPLWTLSFAGYLAPPTGVAGFLWHAHEMIYGFVAAVIAGFLLTASQNWTGRRGVHGARLAALFAIWLLARALAFAPASLLFVYSAVDAVFFPLLATALWPYLAREDQRKHWIFFLFFALLFAANALFHLEVHGWIRGWFAASHSLAVHTVVAYLTVIGGRVIPFFTESAIPAAKITRVPAVESAVLPLTLLFAACDFLLRMPEGIAASSGSAVLQTIHTGLAALACAAHAARLVGWRAWQSRGIPILWILHAAYGMLVIGFAFHAVGHTIALGPNSRSIALHAFTAGAMGLFIYGMISRVALGHTGRPIQAAAPIVFGYALLMLAVALRVFAPPLLQLFSAAQPGAVLARYPDLIFAAGIAWTIAYAILFLKYAPMLVQSRIDGKAG
ncbi:MAG: NnrS family protein [bacterium]|nr:NnrS family protein [bacterium]